MHVTPIRSCACHHPPITKKVLIPWKFLHGVSVSSMISILISRQLHFRSSYVEMPQMLNLHFQLCSLDVLLALNLRTSCQVFDDEEQRAFEMKTLT